MDNRNKYIEYRTKYDKFIYKSYDITDFEGKLKVTYHFEIPGLAEFNPSWVFNKNSTVNGVVENLVFYLGMVELISYWKSTCAPNVEVLCGELSDKEKLWWKSLYFDGLGEFFYVNGITPDFDDFMKIESKGKNAQIREEDRLKVNHNRAIIPVGGGKDSVTSMELVKKSDYIKESMAFVINPRGATIDSARVAGYEDMLSVKRTLDKRLLELNAEGYLNGHTPFSAIVAFSSVLTAYINGYNYVILSNESSANESTVSGTNINHQYSKGYEFEKGFFDYEEEHVGSGVQYFSLLRPLSEYQIAWIFSKYKKYHKYFRSCNVGSKADIWCGKCPKCLFVYLILSPFLTKDEVIDIFGTDMLNDEDMKDNFDKLIGNALEKPFECVGSRDEVNTAIAVTIANLEKEGIKLPKLLEYYKTTPMYKNNVEGKSYDEINKLKESYRNFFDEENNVPEELIRVIKEELASLC